jgi:hypothetical protein
MCHSQIDALASQRTSRLFILRLDWVFLSKGLKAAPRSCESQFVAESFPLVIASLLLYSVSGEGAAGAHLGQEAAPMEYYRPAPVIAANDLTVGKDRLATTCTHSCWV